MTQEHPIVRQYVGPEIVVNWRPSLCVHCQACITGLPQVFDLNKRPWVNISGASAAEIKSQVAKCEGVADGFPFAALSIQEVQS